MIDNRQQSMVVRGVGLIQSVADIESSVVAQANGVSYLRAAMSAKCRLALLPRPAYLDRAIRAVASRESCSCGAAKIRSEVLRLIHQTAEELNAEYCRKA